MKKSILVCLLLMLLLSCRAEGLWDSSREIAACSEGRSACAILQTVMTGSFARFDAGDNLNNRVFSAALPMLCGVSEEDIGHFCAEYGVEKDAFYPVYYDAVSSCLWADILCSGAGDAETRAIHKVLLLFLNPDAYPDALSEMEYIRSEIQDSLILRICELTGTPEAFIRHLIWGNE